MIARFNSESETLLDMPVLFIAAALIGAAIITLYSMVKRRSRAITISSRWFRKEYGLGDVIKAITKFFHIEPCEACEQRAAILNDHIRFSQKPTAVRTYSRRSKNQAAMQNMNQLSSGAAPSLQQFAGQSVLGSGSPATNIIKRITSRGNPPPGVIIGLDKTCVGGILIVRRWYLDPLAGKVYYTRGMPSGFCNRLRRTSSPTNQFTSKCKNRKKKRPPIWNPAGGIPKDFATAYVPPPIFLTAVTGVIIAVLAIGTVTTNPTRALHGIIALLGGQNSNRSTIKVLPASTATTAATATIAPTATVAVTATSAATATATAAPTATSTPQPFQARMIYVTAQAQTSGLVTNVTAQCPKGSYVTGGGFTTDAHVIASYPLPQNTWDVEVYWQNASPTAVTASANCMQTNQPLTISTVTASATGSSASTLITATSNCNGTLLGGGATITPAYVKGGIIAVYTIVPNIEAQYPNNNGWTSDYFVSGSQASFTITNYTICAANTINNREYANQTFVSSPGSLQVSGQISCPANTLITSGGYYLETDLLSGTNSSYGSALANVDYQNTTWYTDVRFSQISSFSYSALAVCDGY